MVFTTLLWTDPVAAITAPELRGSTSYQEITKDMHGMDLKEKEFLKANLRDVDLSGADLRGAVMNTTLLQGADLRDADLSDVVGFASRFDGADLRGAVLTNAMLMQSRFTDAQIEGADFTDANLEGAFGFFDLSSSTLSNTTCPDGSNSDETGCASGVSEIPPPLAEDLFFEGTRVQLIVIPHKTSMYYMGTHEYIPGVGAATIASALIIGEDSWKELTNASVFDYPSKTWIVRVDGVSGTQLESLASQLKADARVSEVLDWSSTHKEVERNGGLIFGTPGLLSLQFVVASVAAVASSFVFLSLVLSQRQKELAVLQAIGASPNQIIRLVLFEILSIVVVSMALGIILGVGLALSFNGFFDIFGFIFQIFGGSSTTIQRTLVYPWSQIILVSLAVFAAVVVALLVTTRRALTADLASVLKGE